MEYLVLRMLIKCRVQSLPTNKFMDFTYPHDIGKTSYSSNSSAGPALSVIGPAENYEGKITAVIFSYLTHHVISRHLQYFI